MDLGELRIEVTDIADGPLVRVDWRGKGNALQPTVALAPIFDDVLVRSRANGATVDMHFEELEFFNSATITAVLHFIRRARAERRTVVLNYHGGLRWQRYCFDALAAFEKDDGLVRIRPLDIPAVARP